MITPQDAEFLSDFFPTKEEFQALDLKFDKLLNTTDAFMAEIITNRQERASITHNQSIIQEWMRPVSQKTGVDYPF